MSSHAIARRPSILRRPTSVQGPAALAAGAGGAEAEPAAGAGGRSSATTRASAHRFTVASAAPTAAENPSRAPKNASAPSASTAPLSATVRIDIRNRPSKRGAGGERVTASVVLARRPVAGSIRGVFVGPALVGRPAVGLRIVGLCPLDVALHLSGGTNQVAKADRDPEKKTHGRGPARAVPVADVEPVTDARGDEDRQDELDPHTAVPAHVFPGVRHGRPSSHIMRTCLCARRPCFVLASSAFSA